MPWTFHTLPLNAKVNCEKVKNGYRISFGFHKASSLRQWFVITQEYENILTLLEIILLSQIYLLFIFTMKNKNKKRNELDLYHFPFIPLNDYLGQSRKDRKL